MARPMYPKGPFSPWARLKGVGYGPENKAYSAMCLSRSSTLQE